MDETQLSWITAPVHMYEYFGGVVKIIMPSNCCTAVDHNKSWKDQNINTALSRDSKALWYCDYSS